MFRNIIISISVLLLLFTLSYAQEASLTITGMSAEPATVSPGGKALISCRVSHPGGPMSIERVAATVIHGDVVSVYPKLYDDGTHGDKVSDDGIYSSEIKAANTAGESKITFHAVDTSKNEINSEPIILTIK